MVNLTRTLSKTFARLSLTLILHCLQGVFAVILTFSQREIFETTTANVINIMHYGICSAIMLVCFTIYSSMIPEKLTEIRLTVRKFLNKYGHNRSLSEKNLFCLTRIESEEIVHISVCGMFYMTRYYILSASGALLTYGLLIINLRI